jgi:hypothetical protein
MRHLFFLITVGILLSFSALGQSNQGTSTAQTKVTVDTIPPNSGVFVGENVVSCNVTYIIHGICLSQKICGPFLPRGSLGCKSGDIILVDEIIATDKNGKQIKLPARKFVIK